MLAKADLPVIGNPAGLEMTIDPHGPHLHEDDAVGLRTTTMAAVAVVPGQGHAHPQVAATEINNVMTPMIFRCRSALPVMFQRFKSLF